MPNAVKCVASYQCNYECGQAIVFRGARSLVQLLSRSKTQKIPEKKKKRFYDESEHFDSSHALL